MLYVRNPTEEYLFALYIRGIPHIHSARMEKFVTRAAELWTEEKSEMKMGNR